MAEPLEPRTPPTFGHPVITRVCTRWLGDLEHLGELGTVYSFFAAHPLSGNCGMPGSCFIHDENTCTCDVEEAQAVDG